MLSHRAATEPGKLQATMYGGWARWMCACLGGHAALNAFGQWVTPGSSKGDVLRHGLLLHMFREVSRSLRAQESTVGFAQALLLNPAPAPAYSSELPPEDAA